jgi:hypothetical protein
MSDGDGDVRAGADGDAEVGGGQGGGVVDAVADHGHDVAVRLEGGDPVGLVGRQHLGDDVLDADLAGDGLGGRGVVAGDHPYLQAEGLQLGDSLGGVRLDGVGNGDQTGQEAVHGDVHRGGTGGRGAGGVTGQRRGVDAEGVHVCPVADRDAGRVDRGADAVSGVGGEVGRGLQGQAAGAGGGHDGLADRVLASDLRGGDQGQQRVGVVAGEGRDVLEGGSTVGDGAGLVQDDCGQPAGGLQRPAVADEDAELGGLAGADHDRGRGRQAQGAGARDDEDGDRGADGQDQPVGAGAERHPADERGERGEQDRGHEPG